MNTEIKRKRMTVRSLPVYKLGVCTYKAKGVNFGGAPMPEEGTPIGRVINGMIKWLKDNNASAEEYVVYYFTPEGEYKVVRAKLKNVNS